MELMFAAGSGSYKGRCSEFKRTNMKSRFPKFFCRLVALLYFSFSHAEEIKVPIIADNSICCHQGGKKKDDSETDFNQGASQRIKMKGIENILVLKFDPLLLRDKKITQAWLYLKPAESNHMVRKVGFSTIATDWNEGVSNNEKGRKGDSCYLSPALGAGGAWAGPNSCFLDVIWGRGGTFWTQSMIQEENGWFKIPVDGRLLEACAAGLSYGIAVSDDNGQTKNIHKDLLNGLNGSNNYFFSKDAKEFHPYFVVQAEPTEPIPPSANKKIELHAVPWERGATLEKGGIEIQWQGPATEAERQQILGYRLGTSMGDLDMLHIPRWMNSSIPPVGEMAKAFLGNLPAATPIRVTITSIGRGGQIMGWGEAHGTTSARFAAPIPLRTVQIQPSSKGNDLKNGVVRVWAMPDLVKANPITGNVLEEDPAAYEGEKKGEFDQKNLVWDSASQTVRLNALKGEWIAFQLVCENLGAQPLKLVVKPGALKNGETVGIPAESIRLSRAWYIKMPKTSDRGWYVDPLVPLAANETFEIPDPKNAVPQQKNQTVYVEMFVPKKLKPGNYQGDVSVIVGEKPPLNVKVSLDVGHATIPDEAHFVWSMNNYSSPGNFSEKKDVRSPEFLAMEQGYYRLAHEHRTTLAVLHYYQNGKWEEDCMPPLAGEGKAMKVSDWSIWDKRFGPLYDGSAFKGTEREIPLDHFYIGLQENWPTPMTEYKWNDVKWEEHWKVAGTIEEGFSQKYKDQWVAVAKEYQRHIIEKKWKTSFQAYMNNKYLYKKYDDKKRHMTEGSSFWLLDEPMHIDDYMALAFYGRMVREAQNGNRLNMIHRVDVSRPEWGRDTLDRLVDLNDTGGHAKFKEWLEDWRERYDQHIWTYGGTPNLTVSALAIELRAVDLFTHGAEGFVPWKTTGPDNSWTEFTDTTIFYTGKPVGVNGPCASLRLKAFRKGEQDVEYIWLMGERRRLLNDPDRRAISMLIAPYIQAKRDEAVLDEYGATSDVFDGLKPEMLEVLRRSVAGELVPGKTKAGR
jgi:hypothetical protein